ncbi:MAG: lyase family protein [Nocardioidaceae bacterium]
MGLDSSTPSRADVGLLSPVWVGTSAEALTSDAALVEAMRSFERALAAALAEHSLAPAAEVGDVELDVRAVAEEAVAAGNPTLSVLARLRGAAEDGRWLHHGATSQDLVDSALMTTASGVLRQLDRDLVGLADRLAARVRADRSVLCVARTLTQQAMPTTVGFRVAGWLSGVHDALELVRGCLPLPVSLGGPVGTAAAYGAAGPAVVDSVAAAMGLAAPVVSWHTRRTPLLTLGTALAAVGEACGRIGADLLLMSQTEVGEASDGSAGASSAMPHKANPVRSVLVVSAARQLPALLSTIASAGAAASERPAGEWHAEWQPLRTMMRLAGAAAEHTSTIADELTFDPAAMTRNLALLLTALDRDERWATEETAHVGVWVDRVLARHQELCG